MSRLPPTLLYLTIYNPSLKPSDPVPDDDEDAEEQAHILFYTSRERAVSRDKMLRQVGLAKALINFSEMFVPEDACDNVHSQSRRMLMVSPEPGFWIHACIELAKTPRPPPPTNKGKNKDKGKGKSAESSVVYDYHDGSVHDLALRAQVLKGYEEFKLTHGSFTSILYTLGQQALELQLERFFTVWAWKWDIQGDAEFSSCLGVPLHPLYKSIRPVLDDFVLDCPFLKDCAPFVLAYPHIIPSTNYTIYPPSSALPSYVRSRLRTTPTPPQSATPSEPSPTMSKPGTDILVSGMNATREAMEATGQAFVAIGASMNVRKWSWPGYLTFNKGTPQKAGVQEQQPADVEKGSEKVPAESVACEPVPQSPGARIEGEVDKASLHEAMSTDGIGTHHEEETVGEDNASSTDSESASQTEEITADADVTLLTVSQSCQDEQDPSPPASPSTPIVHPPNIIITSPPSPSSSQGTLPVPVPAPSFRAFSLHFSPHDDPFATAQRRVLYITKDQLALAFLEPTPTISDEDNAALYQASSALLANIQGLIDHDEASAIETPVTAAKILQPKDKYVIVAGKDTTVTSAEFSSYSEHLFNGSRLVANGDATEVFSRTQAPPHWHVARREPEGTVYLEVLRKETSLADVENELVGIVRRFRDNR